MFHLAPGDVIVAGTDGLFSNLFDNEVAGAIVQGNKEGLEATEDGINDRPACSRESMWRLYYPMRKKTSITFLGKRSSCG